MNEPLKFVGMDDDELTEEAARQAIAQLLLTANVHTLEDSSGKQFKTVISFVETA